MFSWLFVAGLCIAAMDDDSEWRSKEEAKQAPVRSLSDDWDDDAPPLKKAAKALPMRCWWLKTMKLSKVI